MSTEEVPADLKNRSSAAFMIKSLEDTVNVPSPTTSPSAVTVPVNTGVFKFIVSFELVEESKVTPPPDVF
jgi:hypothetical protein